MVIDAFYGFRCDNSDSQGLSITRMYKVGNNEIFNMMFENADVTEISKLGPIEPLNNYVAYVIKTLGSSMVPNPLLFESSLLFDGYGIVKTPKKVDAILFRITDYQVFEVYVFNGRYSSQVLLLQMLKDGALDISIESIKAKIIQ